MFLSTNSIIWSLKTQKLFWGIRILTIFAISYVIIKFAWISDDAQITLRQVWNFVQGDGITFNISDRVQAFTHPLWFLILSSVIFITQELYFTTVILSISIAISSILVLFIIELIQEKGNITVLTPILLLLFSWSFCDYTTSGLENPLTFLLIGLLLYCVASVNWRNNFQKSFIIMSLLVLNRIDYFLLFLPITILLLYECKSIKKAIIVILPGTLLLISWFSFATFYFGFPLPNTFYAKLSSDIEVQHYLTNGLEYLMSLQFDTSSIFIVLIGALFSLHSKNKFLIALSIGQFLYLFYIVLSGGDFMIGRYFSVIIYLSVGLILLSFNYNNKFSKNTKSLYMVGIFLFCLINGSTQQYPFYSGTNINYKPRIGYNFISDERGTNYRTSGLWSKERINWEYIKYSPGILPNTYRTACGWLGGLSMTDTANHLIDLCTLSDPFLARLPPIQKPIYTPGHLIRMMPTNYGERLIGNINSLPDQELNSMLDDFLLITRGDLFSWERLKAIWRVNTGSYDHLDLSDYRLTDPWKLRTTIPMKIFLDNWSEEMQSEKLPLRFHPDIKKFNGNLLVESKTPRIASGIWVFVDFSFVYEIYVNKKLTFTDISQDPNSCKGLILRLPETQSIKSINLVTTSLKDINYSASNRIRFLRLLTNEEEIHNANSQDCQL